MIDKIQRYLQQIETEKNIKILLACETGSRAWGFPSPDSDFDVRVIYVHQQDWYLSINERKDTFERMLENREIDIAGWELRKALRLLKKSNPSLLERIQSPIVYHAEETFIRDMQQLADPCYSKIATMHHYLSMCKKMMDDINDSSSFKLKRLFYALRTATLCKWILERDTIPPIEFQKVYKNLDLDAAIIQRIDELIAIKSDRSEAYLHTGESRLIAFINQCIATAEAKKNALPTGKCNTESLNQMLRKYIPQNDDH